MSGGSYNYAYQTVVRFALALESGYTFSDVHDARPTGCENNHDRIGFAAHLYKVADAMRAIEWVDSGDSSHPVDTHAIHAVTGT